MQNIPISPENEHESQLLIESTSRPDLTFANVDDRNVPTKEEFLVSLERSIREINDYRKGKIKLRSAYDVLNEL